MKNRSLSFSAILLCLLFSVTTGLAQEFRSGPPPQIGPTNTRILIDSIRSSMTRFYVFPDTAEKMVAYIEAQYKKGAYKDIKDPEQLADRLTRDMQTAHHDGHFHLHFAPGFDEDLRRSRSNSDTTGQAERRRVGDSSEIARQAQDNFGFHRVELFPGNIGYLVFHGFSGAVREAKPTLTAAFRFLSHCKALIIDLRENGGGSPDMVAQIESYLFAQRTHMNDIVDRPQRRKAEFWADPARAEGVTITAPVYILTARRTFSAAEDFTYGMQQTHRAIIVGDTTGGGAHPVGPRPLGQGYVADVPFARSLNPYTHTDWEGTGVIPDVPVPSEKALTTARKLILDEMAKAATGDDEKRRIQWRVNDLLAQDAAPLQDLSALTPYCGTYQGGLEFYTQGNDFFCRNPERGNEIFKLRPIDATHFVLDENVHVEFTAASMTMSFSNGRVSVRTKEK